MTVTVRFAPSPTGHIHIGNARTALMNWLFKLKHGGRFILRYDDTDTARSREEYAEGIARDVAWLGIVPDLVARQSDRLDKYAEAAERLKAAGWLYPCYETAEELELKRKILLGRRLPPIYGREALRLSAKDRFRLEAEGRKPHWRFRLPNSGDDPFKPERTEIHWNDLARGKETVDLASLSDPVLIREDGGFLYTFTSVVDDIDLAVSHIIRGGDHITNTGVQMAIFRALGAEPPGFAHHNLLTDASGEGLSKRTGAMSIHSLREAGYEPLAVAAFAVLIGTSENVAAPNSLAELAGHFDLDETSRSAAKFDAGDLARLSAHVVHGLAYETVADRLAGLGVDPARAASFWQAVRGNCDHVADAAQWWRIVAMGPEPRPGLSAEDADFVRTAFAQLPPAPWGEGTYAAWIEKVKTATGRKGKALFLPLRTALTGLASGPELADLLLLLGPEGIQARRP
ncbi:MAG: glutamate--tRNA ligase [Phyllobacteriaceae bacterium]|nr:glutamate--tRNA ligase [Phyllobacteriaceae bacterium]